MKYMDKVTVLIPYMDGRKQYLSVSLKATDNKGLDKKGLLKIIRKYIHSTFKKNVSNGWVLKNCPIFPKGDIKNAPSHMKAYRQYMEDMTPSPEDIENFIQWMKDDGTDTEVENQGHPEGEVGDTGNAVG